MSFDVILTGVGGQGTVLAARALGRAAIEAGYEVRGTETIGMAQREGSVISYVRIGHDLAGGLIPDGRGDVLLGFDLVEAIRGLSKLKPGGLSIINRAVVVPVGVTLGTHKLNREQLEEFVANLDNCVLLNATELASRIGSSKATNSVILGVLSASGLLPISREILLRNLLSLVPEKFKELNARAFEAGEKAFPSHLKLVLEGI